MALVLEHNGDLYACDHYGCASIIAAYAPVELPTKPGNLQLNVVGRAGPARRSAVFGAGNNSRAAHYSVIGEIVPPPVPLSESAR